MAPGLLCVFWGRLGSKWTHFGAKMGSEVSVSFESGAKCLIMRRETRAFGRSGPKSDRFEREW